MPDHTEQDGGDPELERLRRELPGHRVDRRRFLDGEYLDVQELVPEAPRIVRRTAAEVREALAALSPQSLDERARHLIACGMLP